MSSAALALMEAEDVIGGGDAEGPVEGEGEDEDGGDGGEGEDGEGSGDARSRPGASLSSSLSSSSSKKKKDHAERSRQTHPLMYTSSSAFSSRLVSAGSASPSLPAPDTACARFADAPPTPAHGPSPCLSASARATRGEIALLPPVAQYASADAWSRTVSARSVSAAVWLPSCGEGKGVRRFSLGVFGHDETRARTLPSTIATSTASARSRGARRARTARASYRLEFCRKSAVRRRARLAGESGVVDAKYARKGVRFGVGADA